ncbi:transmembrane protein 238 isoform X1 [Equus przewalskii]|uniref:Transmembrane protein 238 isoform X1 n=1 Tax=Equus przewalskii TaxID=9798 RepID=A0ABM4QJC9_EQUPR
MAAVPAVCAAQGPPPSAPSPPAGAPVPSSGLGRCRMALLLAVALDVAGMAALLTGVFAQLQVRGRDFGDLLIYSGALLVFLSLLGWILWYTGNIEISRQELERDYGLRPSAIARLARKLSRRQRLRPRGTCGPTCQDRTEMCSCPQHHLAARMPTCPPSLLPWINGSAPHAACLFGRGMALGLGVRGCLLLSRARGLSCLGHTHKAAAHALGDIGVQLYVGPSQRGTGGGGQGSGAQTHPLSPDLPWPRLLCWFEALQEAGVGTN